VWASTRCGDWVSRGGAEKVAWNEPTRSFGEENIVGVGRRSFDERYARVVLPVAHRLLKQSLVSTYTARTRTHHHAHSTSSRLHPASPSTTYNGNQLDGQVHLPLHSFRDCILTINVAYRTEVSLCLSLCLCRQSHIQHSLSGVIVLAIPDDDDAMLY